MVGNPLMNQYKVGPYQFEMELYISLTNGCMRLEILLLH